MVRIEYNGPVVSSNDAKSLHWRTLKKKVDPIKMELGSLIRKARIKKVECFELTLIANTRHDIDNLGFTIKSFCDQLKINNVIIDDSPKYFPKLTIIADKTIKRGLLIFEIKEIE